jgi:hypothetical protein
MPPVASIPSQSNPAGQPEFPAGFLMCRQSKAQMFCPFRHSVVVEHDAARYFPSLKCQAPPQLDHTHKRELNSDRFSGKVR